MEQDIPYEITRHLATTVWKLEFSYDNVGDTNCPASVEQIVGQYLKGDIDGLLFADVECIEPCSKSILDLHKFSKGKKLRLFVWK